MADRVFGRLMGVAGDLYLKHMNLMGEKDHLVQLTYKRITYRLQFLTVFVIPGQDE